MLDQRMTGALVKAGLTQAARSADPCQQVWEGEGIRVVLTLLLGGETEAEVLRGGRLTLIYSVDRLRELLAEGQP